MSREHFKIFYEKLAIQTEPHPIIKIFMNTPNSQQTPWAKDQCLDAFVVILIFFFPFCECRNSDSTEVQSNVQTVSEH